MNWKKIIIIGLLPIFLLIVLFTFIVTKVDYNDKMPPNKQEMKRNSFQIKNHLTGLSANNLINAFPYKIFLDSIDIYNIDAIKESILEIDAFSKDNMLTQQIVSIALTDSLLAYSKNKFNSYKPDSLILQLQWVEPFKYYADVDKVNENLYKAIDGFWMDKITNNLNDFYKEDYWLKYDYKFKFISSCIEEQGYNTTVGFNDFEKVINNAIGNKYSYIYERFCTRTTTLQKFFLFLFLFLFSIVTIYGYYCIFKIHKKS
jgi:hypothetical protein